MSVDMLENLTFTTDKASNMLERIKSNPGKFYPSFYAKQLLEDYKAITVASSFQNSKPFIKISGVTHHSYANIPIATKLIAETDNVLFIPVKTVITEIEKKFYRDIKGQNNRRVQMLYYYYDVSLDKPFDNGFLVTAKSSEPKDMEIADPYQFIQACNGKSGKCRTQIIDSTSVVVDNEKDDVLTYITDDDEEITFTKYKERPVAFFIMGVGYTKELGYFKAVLPLSTFARDDLSKKKDVKFEDYHHYILNTSGKFKVKYSNIFLIRMKYHLSTYPILFTHATITNHTNHSFEVLYPQRYFSYKTNKWLKFPEELIMQSLQHIKNGSMEITNIVPFNGELKPTFQPKYIEDVKEEAELYQVIRQQKLLEIKQEYDRNIEV